MHTCQFYQLPRTLGELRKIFNGQLIKVIGKLVIFWLYMLKSHLNPISSRCHLKIPNVFIN